ncbi:MAG: CoA pyrophosphatase [Propionibacteriaceae bacterium]|nr:CoA pyrophosphatase [Propionibacteriaceae bacterium]
MSGLSATPDAPRGDERAGPAAAVLVLLTGVPEVVLVRKRAGLRFHGGQVAFPGGALEPGEDVIAAALREAREEAGVDPASVAVDGMLPAGTIRLTGVRVACVMARWERPAPLVVGDPDEIASVHLVPLAELADPSHRYTWVHPSGTTGPGFQAGELFVWGFTAGVLDRLLALKGLAGPWDATRRRPIPEAFLSE